MKIEENHILILARFNILTGNEASVASTLHAKRHFLGQVLCFQVIFFFSMVNGRILDNILQSCVDSMSEFSNHLWDILTTEEHIIRCALNALMVGAIVRMNHTTNVTGPRRRVLGIQPALQSVIKGLYCTLRLWVIGCTPSDF